MAFLAFAVAAPALAQQIRFAEPLDLQLSGPSAQFDAYGRRFSLSLTDNDRVLSKLPAQRKLQLPSYKLLRGSLDGQPGSWVRLTQSDAGIEGAIWDGHDLYAVTSYGRIAGQLTTPIQAAPGQTVIYKLADASDLLPRDFCALEPKSDAVHAQKQTGLDQYRAMVGELQTVAAGQVAKQIEISLIADTAFANAEGANSYAAMLARLNIVEGIYSEQVGLLVLATDVRIVPPDSDPFTSTVPVTLLEQMSAYRTSNATSRARGVSHLMTGKNLDGTTAGIAYVNSACEVERGVSLSERSYGTTISAIVMAHELGHNFGASHDGEAGGSCASVAGGYIMSPSISGYANFSSCSVDVIKRTLDEKSCVTPADYADAAVSAGNSTLAVDGGVPFTVPFTVRSAGTKTVSGVSFTFTMPDSAGLFLDAAVAESASCQVSGLTATCDFGDLAPGEQRAVSITARATVAGSATVHARVTASNDLMTSNDTRDVGLLVRSGIDAAVAVSTDAAEVPVGAPLTIYTDVSSKRALSVRNAVLSLTLNQAVSAASMPGAACAVNANSVICNVAEIAAGTSLRLTVTSNNTVAGPLLATANVSVVGDGDGTNNTATAQAWVQAERDVELTAGPASVDLAVGGAYEIPFLVRSRGPQATGDVALWVSLPDAVSMELLDADGAPCDLQPDGSSWRCVLGPLAPGSSRLVRMRVTGTRAATAEVDAMAEAAYDGYGPNNSATVQFHIDNLVDLAVLAASGGSGLEGQAIDGQVTLRSGGREVASDATLDIEVNAAGVLSSASLHEGADCERLSPQRMRCALPAMARGAQTYVDYRMQFADAGNYDVSFTLHTPGDTAAANDVLTRSVLVRPYYDIAVAGTPDLADIVSGNSRQATFTVSTGRRALATARFTAKNYLPGITVTDIRASAGDCRVDADAGGLCDFTDLPADSQLTVTVAWRADHACDQDVAVSVNTPGDVVVSNNQVIAHAQVLAPTDLDLRVASAASGTSGATLAFPPISIVNNGDKAFGAKLEITLPAEVSLVNISAANAICSGTDVLRCDFSELEANSTSTVNLSVRANARGSYSSALKLTSINDTNPANDSASVAFSIASSSTVSEAKTSGGGGGGRFEWLGLAVLLALVTLRQFARRNLRTH